MKMLRFALFGLASVCIVTLTQPGSAKAALFQQDQAFLASLSAQVALVEPFLGESRQAKRILARIAKSQQQDASKPETLSHFCLIAGDCQRFRYRRYRRRRARRIGPMGPRARAYWYIARGWWQLGSAYSAAFLVGVAGLTINEVNLGAPIVSAYFGTLMIPVFGPLISFIIAMTNIRGSVDDIWWILGGVGAMASFIPQVIGMAFMIVGYSALRSLNRLGGNYGNTDPNKPGWAITPYADPNGGGLAVFGRF